MRVSFIHRWRLAVVLLAGLVGIVLLWASAGFASNPLLPTATTGTVVSASPDTATVSGVVDRGALALGYYFQYGPSQSYGSSTPTTLRLLQGVLAPTKVTAELSGLTPGTIYHDRLVVNTLAGPVYGQDYTFGTAPRSTTPVTHGVVSPNNVWLMPRAVPAKRKPLGWVLMIHGGGWQVVGKAAVLSTLRFTTVLRQHGWATYDVDYRRGEASLADVEAAYDRLRSRAGASATVCADGGSAGGTLALLLAEFRPTVNCVISEGGLTDLPSYAREAPSARSPLMDGTTVAEWVYTNYIVPSFGSSKSSLWWWSPVRWAGRLHVHMLLGASSYDRVVPFEQMKELKRRAPGLTTTMLLAGAPTRPGYPTNFTHASVTAAALAAWNRAELSLLSAAAKHHG